MHEQEAEYELRKHERFNTWLEARISPRLGGDGRRALIIDISEGGAGIRLVVPTTDPIPVNRFHLEPALAAAVGDLPCELVKQTASCLHVRFLELTEPQELFLQGLMEYAGRDAHRGLRAGA